MGLLLLGLGVFLLSLLALHFYITKVLAPTPPLSAFCTERNGILLIRVTNLTDMPLKDVKVVVDGQTCALDLPPRSSDICRTEGRGGAVFRVEVGDVFRAAGECFPVVTMTRR